jgi:hypothetical protein
VEKEDMQKAGEMDLSAGVAPLVPDDLAELARWAVWRSEGGNKVPYRVTGYRADVTNPAHWGQLERAQRALASGRYSGLAFAFFKEDGLVGIDLDDALDADGNPKPAFQPILEPFDDTYIEISPSGQGLKLWVRGSLPDNLAQVAVGGGGVEMYDHARYFTFTGLRFRGAPPQVEDHASHVLQLYEQLTQRRGRGWPLQPLPGGRIPHGQQHSTLVSLAGTLRARRVCDEAIEACLQKVNQIQCERPGPASNISRIVRSTRKWGGGAK